MVTTNKEAFGFNGHHKEAFGFNGHHKEAFGFNGHHKAIIGILSFSIYIAYRCRK